MESPLHQFQVYRIGSPIFFGHYSLSFTNISLWMLLTVFLICFLMVFGMRRRRIVPSTLQVVAELLYIFVASMVRDHVGEAGRPYFPFIFTLFVFILFANLLGIIPYSVSITGQLIITASLALFIFFGASIAGIIRHRLHFFSLFVIKDTPIYLMPILCVMEVVSYCSRPVSLAIRLFVNMMAGHTMLMVFACFVIPLASATFGFGGLLPIAGGVLLILFEILVACLQAYVFTILSCIYLGDALNLH